MKRWAILVIARDGTSDYVCSGTSDEPTIFRSRKAAEKVAESFRIGMDEDEEFQSINVVQLAPKETVH